jgi:hypothetical protein
VPSYCGDRSDIIRPIRIIIGPRDNKIKVIEYNIYVYIYIVLLI